MKAISLLAMMTMTPFASTSPSTSVLRVQTSTVPQHMTVVDTLAREDKLNGMALYYGYLMPQSPR